MRHGLFHVVAHTRDHFHGVLEELAGHARVIAVLAHIGVGRNDGFEDFLAARLELARLTVNQGDLPLNAQRRAIGRGEINVHGSGPLMGAPGMTRGP